MVKTFKAYEYNLIGVDDFSVESNSRLRFWYNHIRKNALKNDGNIFEFGVYRGDSLIAAALILKELNSKKKIFGFDSFSGFPSYSKFDSLNNFYNLKYFTKSFIKDYKKFINLRKKFFGLKKINPISITKSGNFNQTSLNLLKKKIEYFKLKNIEIVKGSFKKTVPEFFKKKMKISSSNIDCDLFEGYNIVLPHIYANLSKNGYVNLDEYYSFKYPGAKIAIDDFCKKLKIKPKKNKNKLNEFERWYLTKK